MLHHNDKRKKDRNQIDYRILLYFKRGGRL